MPETDAPIHQLEDIPKTEQAQEIPAEDPEADLHVDPSASEESLAAQLEGPPVSSWRVAETLLTLRKHINTKHPQRNNQSDGTIGDPVHQTRASDHNPWVRDDEIGVVTAMDITHDPAHGCDCNAIAERICASRDKRVKYVIWNRRIASSSPIDGTAAWTWRPYTGKNGHTHHIHISVKSEKGSYDSTASWAV